MAFSVFPRAIPAFPIHRNILDDVDAEHINAIQREIISMAMIVGPNPHVYNDINLPLEVLPVLPVDDGGIDADTPYSFHGRYFNPEVKPRDHGTISKRLDFLERGRGHHVFKVRATGLTVAPKATALSERPRGIRFSKPNNDNDPHGMFNGVGVTLRKSGFWVFNGSVVYNLLGNPNSKNEGTYQAAIDHDENWLEGMNRVTLTSENNNVAPVLTPTLAGFFNRGTRITLRTSHGADVNQKVRMARMSGFLLRETVEG